MDNFGRQNASNTNRQLTATTQTAFSNASY